MSDAVLEQPRQPVQKNSQAAQRNGARLELVGVTKKFGAREVLHATNLVVEPGEFVAIVGRSGCGKSTLLRLVAGLDEPSAGEIRLNGSST